MLKSQNFEIVYKLKLKNWTYFYLVVSYIIKESKLKLEKLSNPLKYLVTRAFFTSIKNPRKNGPPKKCLIMASFGLLKENFEKS